MKNILGVFIILALMVVPQQKAKAFVVSTGFKKIENGSYARVSKVTCEPDDKKSCQNLCGLENSCERAEPFCRNCAGTASSLLRELFTEISKLYRIKGPLFDTPALIQYLKSEVYVLLDIKSIYDYYHSVDSELFIQELATFCGTDTANSLLAVTLDSVNQPRELKYILCRDSKNQTQALLVESRIRGIVPVRIRTPIYFY